MSCNCCGSGCHCNGVVVVAGLPVLLVAGAIYGLVRVVGGLTWSLPTAAWVPLSILAAGGTLWGLWLGARVHGRGEPLMLGMFGMAVAALGFVLAAPLALVGVFIGLAAALWSAAAHLATRGEG